MNFLAHYYLLENKENSDIVLGNLLPDLMRGFTKIYNQQIRNNALISKNDLVKGIDFHIKADKIFHEHPYFIKQNRLLKNYILKLQLPNQKYYITTHVLSELIIDHYLVNKYPDMVQQFYQSLKTSFQDDFNNKVNYILNLNSNSKIFIMFKRFIENEYAFKLSSVEGIQLAMNQIIGNKIDVDFKTNNWNQLINKSIIETKSEIPTFLNNINLALKNA